MENEKSFPLFNTYWFFGRLGNTVKENTGLCCPPVALPASPIGEASLLQRPEEVFSSKQWKWYDEDMTAREGQYALPPQAQRVGRRLSW